MRKEKSVSVQSGLIPSVLGVNIENDAETCQHYKIDGLDAANSLVLLSLLTDLLQLVPELPKLLKITLLQPRVLFQNAHIIPLALQSKQLLAVA